MGDLGPILNAQANFFNLSFFYTADHFFLSFETVVSVVQIGVLSTGFHFYFSYAAVKVKRILVILTGYSVFMPLFTGQYLGRLEFCNPW